MPQNVPRVGVITPDKGSGQEYTQKLQQMLDTPTLVQMIESQIAPRVKGGELTPDVVKVIDALVAAITAALLEGYSLLTIACNTLSLECFLQPALDQIRRTFVDTEESFLVITTLDAITTYVEAHQYEKTVLLGTKALSTELSRTEQKIPTLAGSELQSESFSPTDQERALNLVQEIIWRVKALQGSDVSTAGEYHVPLSDAARNEQQLDTNLTELNLILQKLQVETVIMGCTELPTAFARLQATSREPLAFALVDPAKLVGEKIAQHLEKKPAGKVA